MESSRSSETYSESTGNVFLSWGCFKMQIKGLPTQSSGMQMVKVSFWGTKINFFIFADFVNNKSLNSIWRKMTFSANFFANWNMFLCSLFLLFNILIINKIHWKYAKNTIPTLNSEYFQLFLMWWTLTSYVKIFFFSNWCFHIKKSVFLQPQNWEEEVQ